MPGRPDGLAGNPRTCPEVDYRNSATPRSGARAKVLSDPSGGGNPSPAPKRVIHTRLQGHLCREAARRTAGGTDAAWETDPEVGSQAAPERPRKPLRGPIRCLGSGP